MACETSTNTLLDENHILTKCPLNVFQTVPFFTSKCFQEFILSL